MPTILVVEDDSQIRNIVGSKLKQHGYAVLFAENGNDGMSKAQRDKPDLILLDMMLPGEGGLQLLKKLRSTPAIASTKVIIATNLESDNVNDQAKALGVSDYIIKADISLDNLLRIVKRKLESP